VAATWSDFNGDGKTDLLVACVKGPNRYFRNAGGGKFLSFRRRLSMRLPW
jgi:hypothetical protein